MKEKEGNRPSFKKHPPRTYLCRKCQEQVLVQKRTYECTQCGVDIRKLLSLYMSEQDFSKQEQ